MLKKQAHLCIAYIHAARKANESTALNAVRALMCCYLARYGHYDKYTYRQDIVGSLVECPPQKRAHTPVNAFIISAEIAPCSPPGLCIPETVRIIPFCTVFIRFL